MKIFPMIFTQFLLSLHKEYVHVTWVMVRLKNELGAVDREINVFSPAPLHKDFPHHHLLTRKNRNFSRNST